MPNFFENLDNMILDMGGRVYLAKDARMSANMFKKSYVNWERFQEIREIKKGGYNFVLMEIFKQSWEELKSKESLDSPSKL